MQRVPLLLIAAGFVFCYVSAPFMGVDLLIDAVGFLLIFNGANALRKMKLKTGPAHLVALGLVAVSALQLFFPLGLLAVLRAVGELALFFLLVRGVRATQAGAPRAAAWPALALGAAACLLAAAGSLWPSAAAGALASLATAGYLLLGLWFALAALQNRK